MTELREELHFKSGDGSCAAWLLRPHPINALPCPVVVMAHGFTATREDGLLPYAEQFAREGIATLAFDYRGFGDSNGGEPQVVNIDREREDLRSAIDFARGLDGIDPRRVALWGSSFGGGLALDVAARTMALSCVIAQVPFTDGPSALRAVPARTSAALAARALADLRSHRSNGTRVMVPAAGEPGSVAMMTSPDALSGFESIVGKASRHINTVAAGIALATLAWRPGRSARRIECPLLVQVASNDAITPAAPAARAAAAARRGELRRYACGHFDVYNSPWFEPVVADQLEFLKRHLMTGAPLAEDLGARPAAVGADGSGPGQAG